ncbi:MAG: hypothetical protein MN733_21710, partial [Nitrososphaera sp.]|nr:hypothetical protein [Nitrososphaera sp.]
TQATNWCNAEKALQRLKKIGALNPRAMAVLSREHLEHAIRPAGYFHQKAKRLSRFARWYITAYGGNVRKMFERPWRELRRELLGVEGIGPETADAILLYAGSQSVFVVDAYTIRIFSRHRIIQAKADYQRVQEKVLRDFPADATVYNEYHALLVEVGKSYCHRKRPDCERCPLGDLPHTMR